MPSCWLFAPGQARERSAGAARARVAGELPLYSEYARNMRKKTGLCVAAKGVTSAHAALSVARKCARRKALLRSSAAGSMLSAARGTQVLRSKRPFSRQRL